MRTEQPYARFKQEELIVRDYLAADRTALACERTFLAYIRTALAIAAAGGSLIHFLNSLAWGCAWSAVTSGGRVHASL
jgi:putative membrane protein